MCSGEPGAHNPKLTGRFIVLLAGYSALLLMLVPRLSLWLDEILGLIGVRYAHFGSLIDYLSNMPGGVPLAYAIQWAVVKVLGYSVYSGRLASVIASLLSCIAVFVLARRMLLKRPLAAVLVYCLLPLQFRYALEARPYGIALCFSVWATVFFFRLVDGAGLWNAVAYGVCVMAGLYSQPYTFFVALTHILWLGLVHKKYGWRLTILVATGVVLAAAAFLPWYLHARPVWQQTAASYHSQINWKSGLLILHELVGAGYIGTIVVLAAAFLGVRSLATRDQRLFWILYVVVPVAAAIAGDLYFGYFLAIRQMLFIVPPLALLAAAGVESQSRKASRCFSLILLIALVAGDVAFLRRPREDWKTAAKLIAQAPERRACVLFVPDDSTLYEFFEPRAGAARCSKGMIGSVPEIDVAVNPYDAGQAEAIDERLRNAGFLKAETRNPRGPAIQVYRRR